MADQNTATEYGIIGARFNEQIYCLKVGLTQHVFTVHQKVLEQSPVLARMTAGGFSESITKEIILPDDDEGLIGRIIELLYGNDDNAFFFGSDPQTEIVEKLAGMYVLGDKYQLPEIQQSICRQLSANELMASNGLHFFDTAFGIIQNIQESDETFCCYYKWQARQHLKSMESDEFDVLADAMKEGGNFAKWTLEALGEIHRADQRESKEEIDRLRAQFTAACSRSIFHGLPPAP